MNRVFVILIVLFSFSVCFAQIDLTKSIDKSELNSFWKADSLFNLGEYEQAIEYYKICDPKYNFNISWPIKKSLCYLLVNDTIASQAYFENYVDQGGYYLYEEQISQIPMFAIISADKRVEAKFRENTRKFENSDSTCLYPNVLKTLLEMRTIDQAYRTGSGDPKISITTIDSLNRLKLDSLISIYGWLGYKEVGKSGENASFLIVQHSDRNVVFQKKCIKMMQKHLFKGNVYPANFALLYDRIKINSSNEQLFGSQVEINPSTNKFVTKSTYSPELLNAYRLYLGLRTIESYLEFMNNRNGLD